MSVTVNVLYKGILAGYLSETDEGYVFSYTEEYLQREDAKPISLTMPLRAEHYKSNVLFPFFDGLIPEGWLLDIAVDFWKIQANDRFQLLVATCRDTIGAVTVEP
jgi:serine/threonine-protein kinase HipA